MFRRTKSKERPKKQIYVFPPSSTSLLVNLRLQLETSVSDEVDHLNLLIRLWQSYHRDIPLSNPLSDKRWKTLGFQSFNPLTDFRGCGLLALVSIFFLLV